MTRRQVRLALGFCWTRKCNNKAREGRRTCQECADRLNEEARRLASEGVCYRCKKRPCVPGIRRCSECEEYNNRYMISRREAAIAEGTCDKCWKRPARPDSAKCDECSGNEQIRNSVYAILDLQERMEKLRDEAPQAAEEARIQFEGLIQDDPGVLSVLEHYEGRWRERRN